MHVARLHSIKWLETFTVPQPQNVDFCLIDPAGFLLIWGRIAPNDITTILPGAIFPVLSQYSCNGSWISVQDYRG